MLVIPLVTALCTAAVAFYVRFMVALCKECKPRRVGYWVRLRLGCREVTTAEPRQTRTSLTRAA